jgi:hypothetical protein
MDQIRAFFEGVEGKYPEQTNRIRLKEEDKEAGAGDQESGVRK